MVFFRLSIVSNLLTFSSNWPPVVGATVNEMTGNGGNSLADEQLPAVDAEVDARWPHRQVGRAPALAASCEWPPLAVVPVDLAAAAGSAWVWSPDPVFL